MEEKYVKKTYFLRISFVLLKSCINSTFSNKTLQKLREEITSLIFVSTNFSTPAALVNARANVTAESSAEFKSNT